MGTSEARKVYQFIWQAIDATNDRVHGFTVSNQMFLHVTSGLSVDLDPDEWLAAEWEEEWEETRYRKILQPLKLFEYLAEEVPEPDRTRLLGRLTLLSLGELGEYDFHRFGAED